MTEEPDPRDASSSISALMRIEGVCQRFEAAWKQGDKPRIEDYLDDAIDPGERSELLRELLLLDLDYRARSEPEASEDEYQARFPQDSQLVSDVFEALLVGAAKAQTSPYCVRIRCPNCQHPIELVNEEPLAEITCPSCDSKFSLAGDTADTLEWPAEETKVGHFQLVRRLGVGAFGEVWQANDLQLDRSVAVKLPRKENLSSRETKQFLREAQAVAHLNHAGIVSVHEVGQQDGRIYIVSDLVQGIDLANRLKSGPYSSHEAAELCIKIADALHHAHEQGIIHRDLKPANIMLDHDGQPHVMDFGLAKREAGEITMTMQGQVLGTPAYMSPEQAKGDAHDADRRSDVYSLGVILFELLTGEHPFRGNQQMLLYQIINDDAPSPRRLNSNIPRDLDTICLKCLEKDPWRRYTSARDFRDELDRYVQGQPVQARPITRTARAWRWTRRHPASAGFYFAISFAMLALVGLGVGYAYHKRLEAVNSTLQRTNAKLTRALDAEEKAKRELDGILYLRRVSLAHAAWKNDNIVSARELLNRCPAGQRNWEWYYLNRICHLEQRTIRVRQDHLAERVSSISLGPNGERVVAALENETVKMWNVTSGEELLRIKGDGKRYPVVDVALSRDGTLIAGAIGTKVMLWDARTGEKIRSLNHNMQVNAISLSPDAKQIAATSNYIYDPMSKSVKHGTVKVWDISSGNELFEFPEASSPLSIAYSPDGARIASGDRDVVVWSLSNGKPLLRLHGHTNHITNIEFSPDGERIVSASYDKRALIWDAQTGRSLGSLGPHSGAVMCATFSLDGQRIATSDSNGTIRIFETRRCRMTHTLKGHAGPVSALAFHSDDDELASGGSDGTIKFWQTKKNPETLTADRHESAVFCIASSPDGRNFATAGSDEKVKIWDIVTGKSTITLIGHEADIDGLAFSHDGSRIASADRGGVVRIWNVRTGEKFLAIREQSGVECVAFSPCGKWLCGGLRGGKAKIWDTDKGQTLFTMNADTIQIHSVAFSPDGTRIVTGGGAGKVKVWNTTTGEEVVSLDLRIRVRDVAFSPTGKWIATGLDRDVKVWDVSTSQEVLTLIGHTSSVLDVAFSPDGTRIASSSADRTIKLWDVASGWELLTLKPSVGGGSKIAISPDGRWIVSEYGPNVWDAGEEFLRSHRQKPVSLSGS